MEEREERKAKDKVDEGDRGYNEKVGCHINYSGFGTHHS